MQTPQLLIFDNDGVVVDSERIANAVCAEVLTEMGFPCSIEYSVEHFLGRSLASTRAHVESHLDRPLPAKFEVEYHQRLFNRYEVALKPVPGIEPFLRQCTTPFCLASSGSHERIRLSLGLVNLLDCFEGHIYSADDVTAGKPAPDLFLMAAAAEGYEAADCVVIEDSPAGVEAAQRAGMRGVGFAGLTPADRLDAADQIIHSMNHLPAALRL